MNNTLTLREWDIIIHGCLYLGDRNTNIIRYQSIPSDKAMLLQQLRTILLRAGVPPGSEVVQEWTLSSEMQELISVIMKYKGNFTEILPYLKILGTEDIF